VTSGVDDATGDPDPRDTDFVTQVSQSH
jgi:hypothetical protein